MSNALVFRCDAGADIGSGHAARSLALAQKARLRGAPCVVIAREMNAAFRRGFEEIGVDVNVIGRNADRHDEVKSLTDQLGRESWLIIDTPRSHFSEHAAFSILPGAVALFDDGDAEHFAAIDLVINPNLEADERRYDEIAPAGVARAVGLSYLPLRREFIEPRSRPMRGAVPSILVTMGGADPLRLTESLAHALAPLLGDADISVLVGPDFDKADRLIESLAAIDKRLAIVRDPANMAELLSQHEIVVSLAGVTLWESAVSRCAVIGIAADDIQNTVLEEAAAREIIFAAFIGTAPDLAALASKAEALVRAPVLRQNIAARAAELVDGRGAERCLDLMQSLRLRRAS